MSRLVYIEGCKNIAQSLIEGRAPHVPNPAACSPIEIAAASLVANTDLCDQLVDCQLGDPAMLERCATALLKCAKVKSCRRDRAVSKLQMASSNLLRLLSALPRL